MVRPVSHTMHHPASQVTDFGYFDKQQGCYVLTKEPPRKWRNVLYNQYGDHEYYSEATHAGDGSSRYRDIHGNTVRLVSYDSSYVYIRDEATGIVWNPSGMPAAEPVTDRVVEFHPSKTVIASRCQGFSVGQRIFVPADATCEAWTVHITNEHQDTRELSVFAYAQLDMSGMDAQQTPFRADLISEIHADLGAVLIKNRWPQVPTDYTVGFLTTLTNFHAATGRRSNFTRADYGLGNPKICYGWNCDNDAGYDWNPAAVLQCRITLRGGESKRLDFLCGITTSAGGVRVFREKFTADAIDLAAQVQADRERARAESYRVDTGHPERDALFNIFVKKHIYAYGIDKSGVRDNLQNDNALVLSDPDVARANILHCLTAQKPDGSFLHSWRPLNRLVYSDKPAWMLQTIPWYVKETGDTTILEESVPYFESEDHGTVWDHLQRSYRYLSSDLGKRGLCRQHHADWNDKLTPSATTGERESVMVSEQLCAGLIEMAGLAAYMGEAGGEQECLALHERMSANLNASAWDGQWYVRTICEDGYCLGSHKHAEGKIFINTQSWAVLGRVADEARLRQCLESVDRYCEKPEGFAVCDPPCSTFDDRVGKFTLSMPLNAENGGCYNHAAGFKAVADCMLGRAEEAWRTVEKVAPGGPHLPVSVSGAEPFAFVNHYSLVPSARGGHGYAWRTGTATWMVVAMLEYILGARRDYAGLRLSPCLASKVATASLVRRFRGSTYNIALDNRDGRCVGAREIRLDGEIIQGDVLPITSGKVHTVSVII